MLAGETYGNWGSDNAGAADYAAVKLDSGGVEVWRYQVRRGSPGLRCESISWRAIGRAKVPLRTLTLFLIAVILEGWNTDWWFLFTTSGNTNPRGR